MADSTQENFRPRPVHELLDGGHRFFIPSYQRGYRWETKQVESLLNDIKNFATTDIGTAARYYLQPLVVRPVTDKDGKEYWEVLDGQQRLTTIYLILQHLGIKAYELKYAEKVIDFDEPDPGANIDSYYIREAKDTIERWFNDLEEAESFYFKISLKDKSSVTKRKVYFIWYVIDTDLKDDTQKTLKSIKVFNNLNKGKISLTSSELIKALLILDYDKRKEASSEQLATEWNEIERQFQNDEFWKFISNDAGQHRVDLLFDFLTHKPKGADPDYSYLLFQNLYDYCRIKEEEEELKRDYYDKKLDPLWKGKGIQSMEQAWEEIKKCYDMLIAWYEDPMLYHYIGFLVRMGLRPHEIWQKISKAKAEKMGDNANADADDLSRAWTIADTEALLRREIMEYFKKDKGRAFCTIDDIDSWSYENDYALIARALLLFNIETYRHSSCYRFSFGKFKDEHWDIEHIDSQNVSALNNSVDWLRWLRNTAATLRREPQKTTAGDMTTAAELASEINAFVDKATDSGNIPDDKAKGVKDKFFELYGKAVAYYACEAGENPAEVKLDQKEKHSIGNLTLLNSVVNRAYKDAPFPYKRWYVINNVDKDGALFIPLCTRNVFLKYYTNADKNPSHMEAQRWSNADKRDYAAAIKHTLEPIFNSVASTKQE